MRKRSALDRTLCAAGQNSLWSRSSFFPLERVGGPRVEFLVTWTDVLPAPRTYGVAVFWVCIGKPAVATVDRESIVAPGTRRFLFAAWAQRRNSGYTHGPRVHSRDRVPVTRESWRIGLTDATGHTWARAVVMRPALGRVSVSNSSSGRHWELDQAPAVGDPTHMVQLRTGDRVSAGEGQRRVARQRRVAACRVVVDLEVGQFPFKITGIPEQHLVEKFSADRPDQALHEWV
jgi:hypothetical protein